MLLLLTLLMLLGFGAGADFKAVVNCPILGMCCLRIKSYAPEFHPAIMPNLTKESKCRDSQTSLHKPSLKTPKWGWTCRSSGDSLSNYAKLKTRPAFNWEFR